MKIIITLKPISNGDHDKSLGKNTNEYKAKVSVEPDDGFKKCWKRFTDFFDLYK